MKYMRRIVTGVVISILTVVLTSNATVINFDDLTGQDKLPIGYAGLDWDPQWMYYDSVQDPYNPSSPPTRIYTHNYGGWIKFGEEVTFNGSWIATSLDFHGKPFG